MMHVVLAAFRRFCRRPAPSTRLIATAVLTASALLLPPTALAGAPKSKFPGRDDYYVPFRTKIQSYGLKSDLFRAKVTATFKTDPLNSRLLLEGTKDDAFGVFLVPRVSDEEFWIELPVSLIHPALDNTIAGIELDVVPALGQPFTSFYFFGMSATAGGVNLFLNNNGVNGSPEFIAMDGYAAKLRVVQTPTELEFLAKPKGAMSWTLVDMVSMTPGSAGWIQPSFGAANIPRGGVVGFKSFYASGFNGDNEQVVLDGLYDAIDSELNAWNKLYVENNASEARLELIGALIQLRSILPILEQNAKKKDFFLSSTEANKAIKLIKQAIKNDTAAIKNIDENDVLDALEDMNQAISQKRLATVNMRGQRGKKPRDVVNYIGHFPTF